MCDKEDVEYSVVHEEQPKYPRYAYENGIEGWTKMKLAINDKGFVTSVKIVDSGPFWVFDETKNGVKFI